MNRPPGASEEGTVDRLPLRKKVLFSLVPLIVLAAAAETLFRILPAPRDGNETVAGLTVPGPDLIWRLRPFERGPLRTKNWG